MAKSKKKPNVLIIMSDDQGPWAMGCAGTAELYTPALDRLAAEGMRFSNCFCASPVCSPARASFLTGQIPSSHGIHDWIKSGNIDVEDGVTWCGKDRPIEYLAGLTAFTDLLADNGYLCGLSGKWHLGDSGRRQKSHDYWCAHSLGGDSYTDYFIFDNDDALEHQSQYVTDLFTDRAVTFVNDHAHDADPFCLSVHYTAPHAPWREHEQPAEIWQHYADQDFPSLPVLPPHPWGGWDPSAEQRRETIQGYFTTITAMDKGIARILDTLETQGITEETLVFFTSDNGFSMGHHGILGKGNGTHPMNMYEEAVKVPFLARCPGRIPAGVVNESLVSHYDFLPTLLELLDMDNPLAQDLPGRSFATPLVDGKHQDGSIVVENPRVFDEYGPVRMIRDTDWKYVHRYPEGPHELYHLRRDPGETTNLVEDEAHTDTLDGLRTDLGEWFARFENPARDGSWLPVTGKGQVQMVMPDDNSESFV
ncbi:MAG: sulfatase-like hydrolase/transferase [Gemmatimonadetes bacterium]|jgi:arylsulfatase A-like enzyme|nr:sulfatase-like hydrolase/transferase [Gemmatimonadota bacterium]MBT4611224.1 sulfatase-like hydrolase/transferase [Gemmatimonadota bacterium]MBT5055477.1 sulfatase-like hydrolase/transferase [Gemmatimonadota bacterium]MBT5143384.1 sulfatase-like hydrolase/transferase [Gemmatimonadota bacterium]MBT5586682.1 sulfatase-like hydrolase/transferase [Gemmatimonadota bacterium]